MIIVIHPTTCSQHSIVSGFCFFWDALYSSRMQLECSWNHWRKSRGDAWGMYPPPPPHTFLVGGWPVQTSPPPTLFEDKINLTFIVKKLTFLTVQLLKTQKNRSLAPLARTQMYFETRSLRFCQYSFLDIIYVKKGVE